MDISKIQSQTPKVDSTPCPPAKNDEVKDGSGSCFDIPDKNDKTAPNDSNDIMSQFEKMQDEISIVQEQFASLKTPKPKDNEPCPDPGLADNDKNGIAPNEDELGEADNDKEIMRGATPDEAEPSGGWHRLLERRKEIEKLKYAAYENTDAAPDHSVDDANE